MNSQRTIQFSLADKILEVAGIASSIAIIVLPMVYYARLPEEIPTHFNYKGLPDAWGGKSSIWALPVLAIALYGGLSLLNSFIVIIQSDKTSSNKQPETLRHVLHLMQVVKLSLSLAFLYIVYATIQVAFGTAEGLGAWFLPVLLITTTIIPLIFVVKIAGKMSHR